MTRRVVLGMLGGGAAAAAAWGSLRLKRDYLDDEAVAAILLERLVQKGSARRIGAAYLAEHPDASAASVLAELTGDLGWRARFASREQLVELVAARINDDFAAGRTTRLGGWVLSATEVRLCALAALPRPADGKPELDEPA